MHLNRLRLSRNRLRLSCSLWFVHPSRAIHTFRSALRYFFATIGAFLVSFHGFIVINMGQRYIKIQSFPIFMEICRAGCRAVVPRQPPNGNPQCGCHSVTALQTNAIIPPRPSAWRRPISRNTCLAAVRWLPFHRFLVSKRFAQGYSLRSSCLCLQW